MKSPLTSLRGRALLGALLWTIGLLAAYTGISTMVLARYFGIHLVLHSIFMTVAAVACLLIGASQFRAAVAPLQQLRSRLAAVRDGRARLVDGAYPDEVSPLVADLNTLLDHRETTVRRAIAKAGDLAHGLKTPLSVLAQDADRAAAAGQPDLAASIGLQVETMRRQVDYHLAHARAAASGAMPGARCEVAESAHGLARTLRRLRGERVAIDVEVPPGCIVRAERADLDEMLGNLLDNACKWARSRVRVGSALADTSVVLTVDDDGPGLDPALRERVLQRGVRADEASPGTGIGLAIVRDLAELYGGRIALERSPSGGLRAELRLPARGRADVSDAG
jgi:signal transduction histidine kinase